MASPLDALEGIFKIIKLGNELRERYKVYAHAEDDLRELDSRLRVSLLVLEVFRKVIQRGIDVFGYRQQQDIANLIDHLQGVFDRCVAGLAISTVEHRKLTVYDPRLDKQLSRFSRDDKLDFVGKLRWTFKGKSGYEAILQEMAEWRSDVRDVVDAIKLLQDGEKEEDRSLYKQLFSVCGGPGIQSASRMDDALRGRESQSINLGHLQSTLTARAYRCTGFT